MNPKLSFYALMSGFAVIVAVVSTTSTSAVAVNPEQTIEQRVSKVREAIGQQDNPAISERQASEGNNLISQWYNNWTNNPWENWSNTGWYNNWTNYNPWSNT